MLRLVLAVLLALASAVVADDLRSERIWTGVNGKTLRGTYVRTLDDGRSVEIATSAGKILTIALDNLSQADRDLVDRRHADAAQAAAEAAGKIDKFKPDPAFDRTLIPLLDPDELELNHRWATNSMATFIVWWDQAGWIEVPRGRDLDGKAQWVDSRLDRFSGRNTTVPDVDEVMKGFAHYFDSRFEDEATYRFHLEYDLAPKRLAQLASGPNACILYARAGSYGPYFALLEAKPDGQVRLGLAGKSIEARIAVAPEQPKHSSLRFNYEVPLPGGKTQQLPRRYVGAGAEYKTYHLLVRDRSQLPEEFSDPEIPIVVGHRRPLIVFRPYLFAEEGETSPPPPEPTFQFPEDAEKDEKK